MADYIEEEDMGWCDGCGNVIPSEFLDDSDLCPMCQIDEDDL